MDKRLSILVCTIAKREALLARLKSVLTPQLTKEVELLINSDSGEKSIGKKRNELLNRAIGEYVSFVDDDDLVSGNYCSRILSTTLNNKPDCLGIQGTITINGGKPKTFAHSIKNSSWFERDGIYFRSPNHLNPIKREIALSVGFPEINHGEDFDFSKRIYPLLKTEIFLDGSIYHYIYVDKNKKK